MKALKISSSIPLSLVCVVFAPSFRAYSPGPDPGDTLILRGTGFGLTNPAVPAGVNTPSTTLATVVNPVTATIGNISVDVLGAALTPGNAGVYQIAVQVPANVPNGDLPVVAQTQGIQSPANIYLAVQQ